MTRPRRTPRALGLLLAAGAVATLPAGCAAPIVFVSAGLAAAQTGTTAYINGELEGAQIAPLDDMYRVTITTLEELEFKVTMHKLSKNGAYVFAEESTGRSIKVFLERKSPQVTKSNIRIGLFGDQIIARLIMSEINARTPAKPAIGSVDPDDEG